MGIVVSTTPSHPLWLIQPMLGYPIFLHQHDCEICAARIRGRPWVANSAWLLDLCGSGTLDYQCVDLVLVVASYGNDEVLFVVIVGIVLRPCAYMYALTTRPISFNPFLLSSSTIITLQYFVF